jgi:hypothetical protein
MDLLEHVYLGLTGTGHLGRFVAPDPDRPRFIKSAAQANAKWLAGTAAASGANGSWAENMGTTTKPIVARAIEQKATMKANFMRSIDDGKWENNLQRVGDAGIKAAAKAKADNYGTGTAAGSPGATKMAAALAKIIAYEAQNLPQIYAMPKGTLAQGKARMNAWADIMAAGAGNFG